MAKVALQVVTMPLSYSLVPTVQSGVDIGLFYNNFNINIRLARGKWNLRIYHALDLYQ